MHDVQSSAVEAIGYDEESYTLYVRFKCKNRYAESPTIWRYNPIPRHDFEALLNGESIGKFVHRIRMDGSIAQEKVEAAEVVA